MYLILVTIFCYTVGFSLYYLTMVYPILRLGYLDWISILIIILPEVLIFQRMRITDSYRQTDRLPFGKQLLYYLRPDDRKCKPIVGDRRFPGLPFVSTPVGVIELLGGDAVYELGDKKITWALEGCDYTPPPEKMMLTTLLYKLGFRNSQEVVETYQGKNPELMVSAYLRMEEMLKKTDGEKIVDAISNYHGPKVSFESDIHEKIDDILKKITKKKGE